MSGLRKSPYLALLPVFVGVFIAADDQTVIVTVLPEIMFDLRVQINELDRASWTITGYLLGYVAAMPLMGRMSDVWGHRNLYVASMLVFMAGSVVAALTMSLTWLIVARVVQAVGAGALVPISIAIVGDLFEPERRAVPLGLMGASAEAGGVIGPLWGGLISRFLDWPWVFWINIPLGALVLVMLLLMLGPSPRYPARIDYIGGGLIAVSLSTLTLALSRIDTLGWPFVVYLVATVVSFGLFLLRQRTTSDPLIPLEMFRAVSFTSGEHDTSAAGSGSDNRDGHGATDGEYCSWTDRARRGPNADANDDSDTLWGCRRWIRCPAFRLPCALRGWTLADRPGLRVHERMGTGHRRPGHDSAPGYRRTRIRPAHRAHSAGRDQLG